jgi:hypothetical protein
MQIKISLLAVATIFTFGCASAKKMDTVNPSTPEVISPPASTVQEVKPAVGISTDIETSRILCIAGQDSRTMEIEKSAPGCKLKYSKFSDKDPVAWSFKGPHHCETVRNQIRNTLESAGFKCGDGESSSQEKVSEAAKSKN